MSGNQNQLPDESAQNFTYLTTLSETIEHCPKHLKQTTGKTTAEHRWSKISLHWWNYKEIRSKP